MKDYCLLLLLIRIFFCFTIVYSNIISIPQLFIIHVAVQKLVDLINVVIGLDLTKSIYLDIKAIQLRIHFGCFSLA